MSPQAEEAAADGLADTLDDEPETVKPDEVTGPQVVDVDTSGERDDEDGIAVGADVLDLPVSLEPAAQIAPGVSLVPVRDELKGLTELAVTLAIAENTPAALRGKPAAVLAVFLTGRELGIPPMTALRNLHVIDGKVTVNPKVRAAMVRREGLGKLWPHQGPREIPCPSLGAGHDNDCPLCAGSGKVAKLCECGRSEPDNDEEECTWHAKRADDPWIIYSSTYTMAMARAVVNYVKDNKTHYLADKDNWKNYPSRMLSWRSLGYLLDDAFPEVGTGLYCVPTRSEALTRTGWASVDKIEIGDEVLAYDAVDNECRWVPVLASVAYAAQQTYRLGHSRWAFTTTGEHRWFVQRKGWGSCPDPGREVRSTLDMRAGRGGTLVLAAPTHDDGPGVMTPRDAAILGWVLTDGWIGWETNGRGFGPYQRVRIVQSKHVDLLRELLGADATEAVRSLAGPQTIRGSSYECREARSFSLRASYLRRVFAPLGLHEKADAIAVVTRLSREAREAMIDAMMLANGHDAGAGPSGQQHRTFHTGRRDVLDVFQALCAAHGVALGHERFASGCWTVTIRRSRGVEVADLGVEPAEVEDVWCLRTELGSWVCRLDGYVSVTGNSPDELGAITDEEGEPVIDVTSTEVLTEKASRERKDRNAPPADPPASPDTVAAFKTRIEKIKNYKGAAEELRKLWQADDGNGQPKLPPVDHLLYRQCKMASAMIDSIEKRIAKGEFGEELPDAGNVEDPKPPAEPNQNPDPASEDARREDATDATEPAEGPGAADVTQPPPEAPAEPPAPAEAPEPASTPEAFPESEPPGPPPFDPAGLPAERTIQTDLLWCDRAPEGLVQEVADGVRDIPADDLLGIMKLLDMSANGLNEATKRARIAARRIRLRMEKMLEG